jgi:hypothetical protein
MDSNSQSTVSRRNVLKAAAAGAVVGIPAVVFMANNLGSSDDASAATAGTTAYAMSGGQLESKQPVVAYVRDASKGEVVVMSGVSEVVITDKKLVAQLLGVVEG